MCLDVLSPVNTCSSVPLRRSPTAISGEAQLETDSPRNLRPRLGQQIASPPACNGPKTTRQSSLAASASFSYERCSELETFPNASGVSADCASSSATYCSSAALPSQWPAYLCTMSVSGSGSVSTHQGTASRLLSSGTARRNTLSFPKAPNAPSRAPIVLTMRPGCGVILVSTPSNFSYRPCSYRYCDHTPKGSNILVSPICSYFSKRLGHSRRGS